MKKQKLVKLFKQKFTNSEGNIDLSNLDFGDFRGVLILNGIKSEGSIEQSNHSNKGSVWQNEHSNKGIVYQSSHSNKGDVYQRSHSNKGIVYQSSHSNKGDVYQRSHSNKGNVHQHRSFKRHALLTSIPEGLTLPSLINEGSMFKGNTKNIKRNKQ